VVSFGVEAETVSWIEGEGVPVVAYAGHARCTVNFDGPGGVAMGTRALLEEGCRDIELWQTHEEGNPPATPESDLSRAFRRSGAGSGIVREARVESGDTLQERGFALAQEVFGPEAFSSSAPRPDGIVLSNDLMAHGALTALRKLGVSPGHDVQIATHANAGSPILLGHDDILLIENDPAELAAAMFNLLEGLMSGDLSRGQSVAISLAPHLRPVGEHAPHPRF
jgi:DNA-binding LacI/PurR family transcriptional regulator